MSPAVRILIGLVAGLVSGAVLNGAGGAAWPTTIADLVGGVWLDGLRMTIVPLVFLLVVTGISSAAKAGDKAIGRRAVPLMAGLLLGSALLAASLGSLLLDLLPLPNAGGLAAMTPAAKMPDIPAPSEWLRGLVPTNPVAAAANGAIVPLTLFAVVFGLAAARLREEQGRALVGVFQAMLDALLVIVGWLLLAAPLGVFALALAAASRIGLGLGAALLSYLATQIAVTVVLGLAMYGLARFARVRLTDFARAAAPAQAIAFSTQSSLASLPAMLSGCERLRLDKARTAAVLPLAVAVFRIAAPASIVIVVLALARLHQVDLGLAQLSLIVGLATLNTLVIAGLPNQITFFAAYAPPAIAAGVPIELLPLMLAIDVIPDMFYTVSNVTADLALAAVAGADRAEPAMAP